MDTLVTSTSLIQAWIRDGQPFNCIAYINKVLPRCSHVVVRRSRDLHMEGTTSITWGRQTQARAPESQRPPFNCITCQVHKQNLSQNAATSSICGSRNLRMGCDKGSFEAGREREKDTNLCLKINSFLKEMPARQGAEANVACHCHWARTLYNRFQLTNQLVSCSPATFLNTSQ